MGRWKMDHVMDTSNKLQGRQQTYLQSVWTTTRQVMAITRTLQTHKMSIKGPGHAVISVHQPVDHGVLDLVSGERLNDLLDIPLRPPSLGEHQLYH